MRKRHRNDYKNVRDPLPEKLKEGERKIIKSRVAIDRTIFAKDKNQKIALKIAKAKYKESLKK